MSTINVLEHGVIADGVTDDSQALKAVFANAAPYDTVVLPAGKTVLVAQIVTMTKPVHLTGGKIASTVSGPALWLRTGNIRITDISLVGAGADTFDGNAALIRANGTAAAPFKNLRFERVATSDSPSSCFRIEYAEDVQLIDVKAQNFAYMGIQLSSVNGAIVERSLVSDSTHKAGPNSYGISVSDSLNTLEARSRNVLIHGNTVRNLKDWVGIETHGGYNVQILSNTLIGCAAGIAIVTGASTRIAPPERGLIANNYVEWTGANLQRGGVRLFGKDDSVVASGVITGNTVVGYTEPVRAWSYDPAKTVLGQNVML